MSSPVASPTATGTSDDVPWRIQGAVYGIGLFSTSIFHIGAVIVPLYAATMTSSPASVPASAILRAA